MKLNDMKTHMTGFKRIFFLLLVCFFLEGAAFAERVCVSVATASSRRGPGEKYEVVWDKLDKNYPLEVLSKKDDWYYVKDYENDTSWINRSYVNSWTTVITKKDRVNVRSGPGSENMVVFMVDSGVPFKVIKRDGDWLQIQHADGDAGWISEKMVW